MITQSLTRKTQPTNHISLIFISNKKEIRFLFYQGTSCRPSYIYIYIILNENYKVTRIWRNKNNPLANVKCRVLIVATFPMISVSYQQWTSRRSYLPSIYYCVISLATKHHDKTTQHLCKQRPYIWYWIILSFFFLFFFNLKIIQLFQVHTQ